MIYFMIPALICTSFLFLLIYGLIKPTKVKMANRKQAFKVYGGGVLISLILLVIGGIYGASSEPTSTQITKKHTRKEQHATQKRLTYSNDPQIRSLQDWVASTCTGGSTFDYIKISDKLGQPELITVTSGNPKIIKAFYYPDAEITITANVKTHKLLTWKFGRQSS